MRRTANPSPSPRRRPAKTVDTYRTTVHRLDRVATDGHGLQTVLDDRHLGDFQVTAAAVAGSPAVLVHGPVPREQAGWGSVLTGLTGAGVSAGSLLVIAVDHTVYALTEGAVGLHLIDRDLVDPGFGVSFAIRAIDPDGIERLARSVPATSGRIDRNLVPDGQHIRQFLVEEWGEIVAQRCGPLRDGRQVSITGADSLQIPLGNDPDRLLDDLRVLGQVCAADSPAPELEFIALVRPIPARTEELDRRLDELLGHDDPDGVGLAVPADQAEYEAATVTYEINVAGSRRAYQAELDLGAILDRVRDRQPGKRLTALKTGRIGLRGGASGRDLLAPPATAHQWLTAEIPLAAARMLYHEGRWHEIGERHLDFLRAEIECILDCHPTVTLPPWASALTDEDADNGYVLLDEGLLPTRQHRHNHVDLLGPNNELIHVERADRSSPLSHLFDRGLVAADALLNESDARQRLVEMVRDKAPQHPITEAFRPTKVVYGIALRSGKPLTVDTLSTFPRVALYRAERRLRADHIDVEVVGIPTS